jgi:uncharacterized protein (TIGR03083 family)
MGNFYVNITVRGPGQSEIEKALVNQRRTAAVSPTVDDFTVIYDEECDSQDPRRIRELTSHLSRTLTCPALAVLNHDDDILWYLLYQNGDLVDEYNSCPDCLDAAEAPGPTGGDADKLCALMGAADVGAVESILRTASDEEGGYLFELDRHQDLAEAVGLPAFAVGLGYNTLLQEAPFGGMDLSGFVRLDRGKLVEENDAFGFAAPDDSRPVEEYDAPARAAWPGVARPTARATSQKAVEAARHPLPILVSHLFPALLEGLLALLAGLSAEEWERPTACAGWSVQDVALHLLGVEVGNLSRKRDRFSPSARPIRNPDDLVALIKDLNETWVRATRRVSPRLLCDLLRLTGTQACEYFQSLDPYAPGAPVSWADPDPAPVWLDLAREYTERWHHQQHIRDAVGKPGFKEPRFFAPVLDAFVRALPHTYRKVSAADGTVVTLTIAGPSGGQWLLLREDAGWNLYLGAHRKPAALVLLEQEVAWRVFTKGLSVEEVRARAVIVGDQVLGLHMLDTVSIIA